MPEDMAVTPEAPSAIDLFTGMHDAPPPRPPAPSAAGRRRRRIAGAPGEDINPSPPEDEAALALAQARLAEARSAALLAMHQQMQAIVAASRPISVESFCLELTILARTSFLSGDFQSAVKAYTVVGQHLGAIRGPAETHQHLHMHNADPSRPPNGSEFARATDAELRRILEDTNAAPSSALPAPSP